MDQLVVKPTFTLKQIYGEDAVYSPRPSYKENPWMSQDMEQLDFLTARELVISNLPTLVHKATQTDKIKELFEIVGVEIPEQTYQYGNQEEYEAILHKWSQEKKKIVFHYLYDEDEINRECYWMDAEMFNYLNCKANIDAIIPKKYVPKRDVVCINQLEEELKSWKLPLILKQGEDLPSSGGYGVMICHTDDQLAEAIHKFKSEDAKMVIVEECLDIEENYCCQYLYSKELGIKFIGASKQITDDNGKYSGNVLVENVPEEIIQAGREIMDCGVEKGFIGVAGFDLVITKNGQVKAIDLNFRQNGSTSMLLLHEQLGKLVNKFLAYRSNDQRDAFYTAIKEYVEKGVLFPLAYYDGDYFEGKIPSRFTGVWYADSIEEIERYEKELMEKNVLENGPED